MYLALHGLLKIPGMAFGSQSQHDIKTGTEVPLVHGFGPEPVLTAPHTVFWLAPDPSCSCPGIFPHLWPHFTFCTWHLVHVAGCTLLMATWVKTLFPALLSKLLLGSDPSRWPLPACPVEEQDLDASECLCQPPAVPKIGRAMSMGPGDRGGCWFAKGSLLLLPLSISHLQPLGVWVFNHFMTTCVGHIFTSSWEHPCGN